MELKLHTISRDKSLYNADAVYTDGTIIVKKGSKINITPSAGYKPATNLKKMRENPEIVDANGMLLADVIFDNLSASASFVTGRTANGMIVWKTEDGKYVRHSLKQPDGKGE